MPKLHKDFRSGNLNEDLGLLLLKTISFVAPVPRTEDVGIDAVCTLHRQEGKLLFAEDSFWVQLKSYSKTNSANNRIVYNDERCQWLKTLRLPFMVGFVDKSDLKIDLYPTSSLYSLLIVNPQEITLKIGPQNSSSFSLDEDGMVTGTILSPLVSWSLRDAYDKDGSHMRKVYEVLKEYFYLELINIETRHSLGNDIKIDYIMNEIPVFGNPGNCEYSINSYDAFSKLSPFIRAAISLSEIKEDREFLEKFLALAKHIEKQGVPIAEISNLQQTLVEWNDIGLIKRSNIQETIRTYYS